MIAWLITLAAVAFICWLWRQCGSEENETW